MSTLVRAATETDFKPLLALVEQAVPETYLAGIPVDKEAIYRWLLASVSQKHLYCVKVAERDKELVGFLFGGMAPLFFNPSYRTADEVLVYVHPSARMSTIAQDLVWSFMEWADDKETPVKITPTGKTDAVAAILERMGFSRVGSIYLRETPNGRRINSPSGSTA